MTKEEIVKLAWSTYPDNENDRIEVQIENIGKRCGFVECYELLKDEIAELKKLYTISDNKVAILNNENKQLQSRIDELQKGNEWISVELNTMPINTPILCYQNNNYNQFRKLVLGYDGKFFRDFDNSDNDDILFNDGNYLKITHWMPLPNKPKTN